MNASLRKIALRKWAGICFASLTQALSLSNAELPGLDGGKSVPVIDVHTHVFNAHDLPLSGILNARKVPLGVSGSLAKILNAWTKTERIEEVTSESAPLAPESWGTTARIMRNLAESTSTQEQGDLLSVLTQNEKDELFEFAASLDGPEGAERAMSPASEGSQRDLDIVVKVLEGIGFPPACGSPPPMDTNQVHTSGVGISGYRDFVEVMTQTHQQIAAQMVNREYPKVDLFVHHMMDMQKTYVTDPKNLFSDQITQMQRLDRMFAGKLIHFVAYDPFRRGDSLNYVKEGLSHGAIGVKVYPPSGHRAAGNDIPKQPILHPGSRARWKSRYQDLSESQLDRLNMDLFTYCAEHQVPVFTHCTPHGFEADDNYGLMSDPKYWEIVLKEINDLRLCFGHSGGEAYWFDVPDSVDHGEKKYGEDVVRLCLEYPNVYCEVGYLALILDEGKREKFISKLKTLAEQRSSKGDWTFGDKIMYGTDWHMIHKERNHTSYLNAFDGVFSNNELRKWRRAFFSSNAVNYLKLEDVAKDTRFNAKQQEGWAKLIEKAKDE
jgi:predicted TIM-barrel fold metal-dependent hydrolase